MVSTSAAPVSSHMPRKRKRKRAEALIPTFVFYNYSATVIQRRWRGTKTCALTHEYLPMDDRIVLGAYLFSRKSLAAHIAHTGDVRHPVSRRSISLTNLHLLGISKAVAMRRRRIYLREVEERESIHKMTFDEFVEMFHSAISFDFHRFMLYVRGYSRILTRHDERVKTHFLALYDEIHNYSMSHPQNEDYKMYDAIVHAILTTAA